MRLDPNLANRLRRLFGSLAFVCLLVAGLAYAATWVVRTGLEREAVAEAGKLAGSVLQPELTRADLEAPVPAARYAELRDVVRKRMLEGPVTSVEVWNADGTIVFADRRARLGEQVPTMRPTIHDATIQGSMKLVEGDTFRSLVGVGIAGDASAVVEIDRSYPALVAEAGRRWQPWVRRGVSAAVALLVLYVLAVAASYAQRRRRAGDVDKLPEPTRSGNAAPAEDAHLSVRRRKSDAPETAGPNAPPYMQPGFREHLEARRQAEDALVAAQQALNASELERQRLHQRLTQTEGELEEARRRLADLGATAGR
jgi:hypothetical protein